MIQSNKKISRVLDQTCQFLQNGFGHQLIFIPFFFYSSRIRRRMNCPRYPSSPHSCSPASHHTLPMYSSDRCACFSRTIACLQLYSLEARRRILRVRCQVSWPPYPPCLPCRVERGDRMSKGQPLQRPLPVGLWVLLMFSRLKR